MVEEVKASVYVWDKYRHLSVEIYEESNTYIVDGSVELKREFAAPSLIIHNNIFLKEETASSTVNVVDSNIEYYKLTSDSSVKVLPENHAESTVTVYDKSILSNVVFSEVESVNVTIFGSSNSPTFSTIYIPSTEKLNITFQQTIKSIPLRHCCDLPGVSEVYIVDESKSIGVHESATILVRDLRPDYLRLIGDCISNVANNSGYIPEIDIPVKIGEYQIILSIPESSSEEIESVYNRPFGIKNDNRKIYGIYISTEPTTITIKLKSGKYLKVNIKPYRSMMIEKLFED